MYRNRYEQGGAADSRQQIFMALSQQGLIGEMSFEEFQQIPPQELRQMLQSIQQQMQGQEMQGQEQEMVQAQYGLRSSNIPPYYNSRAMYQESGNTTGSSDYDANPEYDDQGNLIKKDPEKEEIDWNKDNVYGTLSTKMSGELTSEVAGIAKEQFKGEGDKSAGNVGLNALSAAGQGASAGAEFGPLGAIGGGVGGAAVSLIGDLAVETPGDSTYTANQAGGLGTSLIPELAAHGMRTPQQAEQSAIFAARNRANNPNYVGSNYSRNPYGPVKRAGYDMGGRLKYQLSDKTKPFKIDEDISKNAKIDPGQEYAYPGSPYTFMAKGRDGKYEWPNQMAQVGYTGLLNQSNDWIRQATGAQQVRNMFNNATSPNQRANEQDLIDAANRRAHDWRYKGGDAVTRAHENWKRNQKRYGGVNSNDYRIAYEMGGGYYGKKY